MTQEEIRNETQAAYKQIQEAETKLKELRETCKHPATHIGNYSYRPGHVAEAELCSDCGKMLGYVHF
jgi:hypothetical protein